MANIQKRTGLTEYVSNLQLSGSDQIGRTLNIGNDWRRIRIGFRHCLPLVGGEVSLSTTITPTWYIGLCSGTASMVKSDTCTQFIGWRFTGGPNLLYAANFNGANQWLQNGGSPIYACRKIATTITNGTGTSGIFASPSDGTFMYYWLGEIRKSNTTPTSCSLWNTNTSWGSPADYRSWDIKNLIDREGTTGWSGMSVLYSEDSGSLNTFNMYWNETAKHRIELGDIYVSRME